MAGRRIRTIKPEILDDEVAAGLSDSAWRLWVSVWLLSDDHGRFRANPHYLQGSVFWHDNHARKNVSKLIEELESSDLIRCYNAGRQKYAVIPGWSKHQKVQHPGKCGLPEPPESLMRVSRESHEDLTPDLDLDLDQRPRPTTGELGGEKRVSGNGINPQFAGAQFTAAFNHFFERKTRCGNGTLALIRKALKKGYTVEQLKAACWAAYTKCQGAPDVLANFEHKSILRLVSTGGGQTLPDWIQKADELWDQQYPGKTPNWREA
jgi:hypothetical protein